MLFEIMLFLIKAEVGTLERNSDPLEKWRVKIVQGNETQCLLQKAVSMFILIIMNFVFANQCEYVNDSHYIVQKKPTHYSLYTHTRRTILYVNLLEKLLAPGSEGVDKIAV